MYPKNCQIVTCSFFYQTARYSLTGAKLFFGTPGKIKKVYNHKFYYFLVSNPTPDYGGQLLPAMI